MRRPYNMESPIQFWKIKQRASGIIRWLALNAALARKPQCRRLSLAAEEGPFGR